MNLNLAVLLIEPAAFAVGLAVLRIPEALLAQRWRAAMAALAAVSAVGAVAAGGAPTGWLPVDVVLLAVLGAAVVLAGSRAPSVLILVAAVVCAACGLDSVALPLALAAIGLALVSVLVDAEPLVDAAAAGLVLQAALRLSAPGGSGLTALVATVILVPLLAAGARTLERPDRRRLLRVALGLGAFAVVGAIGGGIAAASAVGPLRQGLSVATTTINATQSVDLQTTSIGLTDAERDFAKARQSLEAWWAFPARAVPVVGQHWRVLRAAAVSGDELAGSGRRALSAPALGDVRVTDGRVPLEQLAAIEPPVADLAGRATAARQRLDDSRSAWLVPPLADKLDSQLGRMREIEKSTVLANRVLPLMPRLLGKYGPRRYFLAVQTPVEARAGGGFMGNYGEITAEDGRLSLTRFGRQDDLTRAPGSEQRTLERMPEYMARYGRFQPAQHWANVNLSPDFPADAAVISDLYPQSGGAPIDGVIAVDPAGLAALLGVVGAVEVPSWPTPINAANALQILLYEQYERDDTRSEREGFLGDVAQSAWRRLTSGSLPTAPEVVSGLGPAVRAKHMFFWAARPDEQRLFEDLGSAGKVAPVTGDFVGLVTQNAGGNKIDYFLRRELNYRARLDPGSGRLQASVTITLHNDAPAEGLSHGLIGNDLSPRLPTGTNKMYLSFYTPWQLLGGRIDGNAVNFESATELGRHVYSTAVLIPPKSAVTLELDLDGRHPEGGNYRLDVHRQPMVAPDVVTTSLALPSGWQTTTGANERTGTLQLESDAVIEIPLRRR